MFFYTTITYRQQIKTNYKTQFSIYLILNNEIKKYNDKN
jgi:hypothetical protein